MINLDQIRALEGRIEKAVALIKELRSAKASLASELSETQGWLAASEKRGAELESRIEVLSAKEAQHLETLRASGERLAVSEARAALAEAKIVDLENRLAQSDAEVAKLQEKAADSEYRILELEEKTEEFRIEQQRIEESITSALGKLDAFEDLLAEKDRDAVADPVWDESPPEAPLPADADAPEEHSEAGQESQPGDFAPVEAVAEGGDTSAGDDKVGDSGWIAGDSDDGGFEEGASMSTPVSEEIPEPGFRGAGDEYSDIL
jgi:hypothetical protein